jgi:hypothetical protein
MITKEGRQGVVSLMFDSPFKVRVVSIISIKNIYL